MPGPEESLRRGPLPYHVCVFVDRESLGFIAGDPPGEKPETDRGGSDGNGGAEAGKPNPEATPPEPKKIQYTLDAEAFAARVARSLASESGTVSFARVLEAPSRPDAVRIAQGSNADLLIAVGFETRPEYGNPSWSAGWGALEVTSWLFGGIPAWFVPTVEYSTLSSLKVELVDLHRKSPGERPEPETDWKQEFSAPYQNVSLWDRSYPFDRPLDYLATIIVPPMVLNPGDPARLSQELTNDLTGDLNGQLAASLRNHLLESERSAPVSVCFLSPDPAELVKGPSLRLRLSLASRGSARVAAFDIHRFAAGVERFRWIMPKPDLENLAKEVESAPQKDGYTSFDVPQEIPLIAGENVVKVRVLRDDGLTVTRTMVYRK